MIADLLRSLHHETTTIVPLVGVTLWGTIRDVTNLNFPNRACRKPSFASLLPNVMLRNYDGKYLVVLIASSATDELHKGHGVAFSDMDNIGYKDLLEEVGGAVPA